MPARGEENSKYQGSKWISRPKRLAIYLRDGLACVWCGETLEEGAQLTLDHATPFSKDGKDDAKNLLTSCLRCNSSRGNRSLTAFAASVADYKNHGLTAEAILKHIRNARNRQVDNKTASQIIKRRGGWTATLDTYRD